MKTSRACRIHRGDVQTAVWTLHQPETRRSVTLVGTYHIGDSRYYREIAALADETEKAGGLVQSEGSELADPAQLLALTEQEKQALAARLPSDEQRAKVREVLQMGLLVPEFGSLERRPHWRYPDVDKLSQVRLLGDRATPPTKRARPATPQQATATRTRSPERDARGKRRAAAAMRWQWRQPIRFAPLTEALSARSVFRTVLTNRQEQNAVLDLLAIPGPVDVLAIWGAGHLPGIRAGLVRNGFGMVEMRWMTAFTKRVPEVPADCAAEDAQDLAMPAGADLQDVPAPQ